MISKLGTETIPGKVDHLGIVVQETDKDYKDLRVANDGLVYNELNNDGEFRNISTELLCQDSQFRPITCSELLEALRNKAFFKIGLTYLDSSIDANNKVKEITKMKLNSSDLSKEFPLIKQKSSAGLGLFSDGVPFNNQVSSEDLKDLNTAYNSSTYLFGNDYKDIYNFQMSPGHFPDLAFRPLSIQLITPSSDIYTDTLNLGEFIHHNVVSGLEGMIELTIRYSTESTGEYEYSMHSLFQAFRYDESDAGELKLICRDFYQTDKDIQPMVQLEYIGGIIRVYPLSSNINECIINSCTLTYAKSN